MRRNPKPENVAKLTTEQRDVFDKWQDEDKRGDVIIQKILDAIKANDKETVIRLGEELDRLIPVICEHGHSIYLHCEACEEIEKIIFPEAYDTNGNRIKSNPLLVASKMLN
jgi:hypothetical protein